MRRPAYENKYYSYQLPHSCAAPQNVSWGLVTSDGGSCAQLPCEKMFMPPGLLFYSNGQIQDVALESGSFEFTVAASEALGDGGDFTAFQNVVIAVEQYAGQDAGQ